MKGLAQEYGFKYETVTADIDEQALGDRTADPAALVTLLAQAKADAICKKMRDRDANPSTGLLITCDQVVVCQDQIREKPTSAQEVQFTLWFLHGSKAIIVASCGIHHLCCA